MTASSNTPVAPMSSRGRPAPATANAGVDALATLLDGLTPRQREACDFPARPEHKGKKHLVIEAGAGAGKTHVLALRAARLCQPLKHGVHPSRLFLVTFSRAADRELRERVTRTIAESGTPGAEMASRLVHVSTIDSLVHSLVETRFPLFWEEAVRGMWASPEAAVRYSPPTLTLLDDGFVKERLEERLADTLEQLAHDERLCRVMCDFLLSGALSRGASHSPLDVDGKGSVLDGLLSAMLSEHLLCLDSPAPLLAAAQVHPGLPALLGKVRGLALDCFAHRVLKGTLTHTDATVFLYNLYCAPSEARAGTLFDIDVPAEFPVAPEELIVDEYQDTSRIQHALLWRLATHRDGRMVVVGDPKQSIYGFRNAHVEVMEGLKRDPLWHHVELTTNFRSDPLLLEEINALSEIAFQWDARDLPPSFEGSPFALSARARKVAHNPLDAGRKPEEAPDAPRVEILSASLCSDDRIPPARDPPKGALRGYLWHVFCRHVANLGAARAPDGRPRWAEVAILCEQNKQVKEAASRLNAAGIPATALLSGAGAERDLRRLANLRANLFLLHALHGGLGNLELFELLVSPFARVPWEETSAFFSHFGEEAASLFFSRDARGFPEGFQESETYVRWPTLCRFHERIHEARACAPVFSFQAWQRLRSGALSHLGDSLERALSDEFTLLFHTWCAGRPALNGYEDLPANVSHWRVRASFDAAGASDPNAVQVMTIHAAKGLEWPFVYFWPQARRARSTREFEIVSHDRRPVVKWLAHDVTSLGVLPWLPNETDGPCSAKVPAKRGKESEEKHFTDLQKELEEAFERQRVFYTAFTRAREYLCLVHPLPTAVTKKSLRDKLASLPVGEKGDYAKAKVSSLEEGVIASYLDLHFRTGHEKIAASGEKVSRGGKGVRKVFEEPWDGPEPTVPVPGKEWVRFTEHAGVHWDPTVHGATTCSEVESDGDEEGDTGKAAAPMHAHEEAGSIALDEPPTAPSEAAASTPREVSPYWGWPASSKPAPTAQAEAEAQALAPYPSPTPPKRASASYSSTSSSGRATTERLRERKHLNPYYERRLKAAEGVLYHVRQETALEVESPARTLRRAARRTWQELEVWHGEPVEGARGDALVLRAPARNMIDFLCYMEASAVPRALLVANVASTLDTLPPDALVACVLDFKTGLPKEEHAAQISLYCELASKLARDGYGLPAAPARGAVVGLLCYDAGALDPSDVPSWWASVSRHEGVRVGDRWFVTSRLTSEF